MASAEHISFSEHNSSLLLALKSPVALRPFSSSTLGNPYWSIMNDKGIHDKNDPGLPFHEQDRSTAPPSEDRRKQHTIRSEIKAFLGELIGTFMFLSLAFSGTQIALNAAGTNDLTASQNPAPDVSKLLYIAFAFGVSLAINVAIFADVSGGKFVSNQATLDSRIRTNMHRTQL
jgi:hypothetical protein